ncbi:phosphatase [Mycobacterium tuberculosis]|nr:phosphatase [Mycobacterium tuberculosis]
MTVILLRHARSTSNTAGVLAGRSGVDLDEKGREQATGLIDRIGDLPIRAVASSPMLRCQRTVEPLAEALCLEPLIDDRFSEVDYGEWTGRKIGDLVDEPLWRVVQATPARRGFPAVRVWRRCRLALWQPSANTTGGWPISTATTCCGWPAPMAMSSRR